MSKASSRKTLKDFSELKPIESRIEAVAHSFLQVAFKGEMLPDFEPRHGSQVHRVWKMAKLEVRHQIAWQNFMDDAKLTAGKSGGVTGSALLSLSTYGDQIDRGGSDGFKIPTARTNKYYRRMEALREFLSRRERQLLNALLQDSLVGTTSLQLELIGLVQSGYGDKISARASGVTRIQALLDRLADFYQI